MDMSDPAGPSQPGGEPGSEQRTQRVEHHPVAARVPERVARGSFATGVLVFSGQQEFVLDFVQGLARPAQLTARIVMQPVVLEQFLAALKDNYARYVGAFGQPPAMPKNPSERQMTPQEIYADLKIADDMLSGAYANTVMISHSPAEFNLDFITSFYPHAAVASRVYFSSPRVANLIETLSTTVSNYRRTHPPMPPQGPSSAPPAPPAGPSGPPDAPPPPPPSGPSQHPFLNQPPNRG